MAIIRRKRGSTIYVFEAAYAGVENGKRKYSWKALGKLDENGSLISTRERVHKIPQEPQEEVKALAIPDSANDLKVQEKTPEEIKAELVTDIVTTRVDKYNFGTTKVEGIAFDSKKNEGLYNAKGLIDVSRNEINRKKVNVIFSPDFNELKKEGVSIAYEYRLTPFDRAVHNAIATLWEQGHRNKKNNNEYLTPRVIFQLLSGNTGNSKDIGSAIREKILDSIDKMSVTTIIIDASAEAKAFGYKEFKYKGNLLNATRISGIIIIKRDRRTLL